MSLPYSSSVPAEDPKKLEECFAAGAAIRILLEKDIKPRDIMTREAFENAMVVVMALGGSTNAVLHLIAMARSVGAEVRHLKLHGALANMASEDKAMALACYRAALSVAVWRGESSRARAVEVEPRRAAQLIRK